MYCEKHKLRTGAHTCPECKDVISEAEKIINGAENDTPKEGAETEGEKEKEDKEKKE